MKVSAIESWGPKYRLRLVRDGTCYRDADGRGVCVARVVGGKMLLRLTPHTRCPRVAYAHPPRTNRRKLLAIR